VAATLVATIAGRRVTFAVTGATGPLRVRWGDGTDQSLPANGGFHDYGNGEFQAIVVDGGSGQRILQSVMVPAPGKPVIEALSSVELPLGPPSDTNLHIYGGGFGQCSQIRFGATLERAWTHTGQHYRGPNEVVLEISGGLFPAADTVPVSVLTDVPGGGESDPVDFDFSDSAPPPPPEPDPEEPDPEEPDPEGEE